MLTKILEYWDHERSLSALLLYMIAAVFLWIPLGDYQEFWWSFVITDLLFIMIVLAGVFSVFTRWRKQVPFLLSAVVATIFRIIAFLFPLKMILLMSYFAGAIFFLLLTNRVLQHIIKDGPVNFYRIQGSMVVYLLIGVIFALVYSIIESISPGSFASTEVVQPHPDVFAQFLYFSFVTLTTLGYGDLIPTLAVAKSLVIFQGMIGMLYPVVMIARLVSMEVSSRKTNS